MKRLIIIASLTFVVGIAFGAAFGTAGDPKIKTVTRTKTHTVTKIPESCLDALNAGDELMSSAGTVLDAGSVVIENLSNALGAALELANGDVTSTSKAEIDQWSAEIDDANQVIDDETSRVDSLISDYEDAAVLCRGEGQ